MPRYTIDWDVPTYAVIPTLVNPKSMTELLGTEGLGTFRSLVVEKIMKAKEFQGTSDNKLSVLVFLFQLGHMIQKARQMNLPRNYIHPQVSDLLKDTRILDMICQEIETVLSGNQGISNISVTRPDIVENMYKDSLRVTGEFTAEG